MSDIIRLVGFGFFLYCNLIGVLREAGPLAKAASGVGVVMFATLFVLTIIRLEARDVQNPSS